MWFILPLCVKWHPSLSSLAKPLQIKRSKKVGFGLTQVKGGKNKNNFNNVSRFHFYAHTTSIQTFQMYASFMSLFSNELILFANLGHTVDGNSCAGIDQGRYYQLLAKTAQLAKRNNYFDPVLWNTGTKSERWMNYPPVVTDVNVKEYLLSWGSWESWFSFSLIWPTLKLHSIASLSKLSSGNLLLMSGSLNTIWSLQHWFEILVCEES